MAARLAYMGVADTAEALRVAFARYGCSGEEQMLVEGYCAAIERNFFRGEMLAGMPDEDLGRHLGITAHGHLLILREALPQARPQAIPRSSARSAPGLEVEAVVETYAPAGQPAPAQAATALERPCSSEDTTEVMTTATQEGASPPAADGVQSRAPGGDMPKRGRPPAEQTPRRSQRVLQAQASPAHIPKGDTAPPPQATMPPAMPARPKKAVQRARKPPTTKASKLVVKMRHEPHMEIEFEISPFESLQQLFDDFCTNVGMPEACLTFTFKGRACTGSDKPGQLGMQNGDCINVAAAPSLSISIRYHAGREVTFKLRPTTRFEKVKEAYCAKTGLDMCGVRFLFQGQRVDGYVTPADAGMRDGDIIDCVIMQYGGKPVILLYPLQETACEVQLSLSKRWDLSCVFPKAGPVPGSTALWNVRARPDGSLTDCHSGKEYPYLFWEAVSNGNKATLQDDGTGEGPRSMFTFDHRRLQSSFCIPKEEVGDWLYDALALLGLTARERTDMVTFWLPQLEASPWNLVHFLEEAEYCEDAGLRIQPAPDTLIRCFMIFQGSAHRVAGCEGLGQLPAVPRERAGFTAVEWGGMNLGARGGEE